VSPEELNNAACRDMLAKFAEAKPRGVEFHRLDRSTGPQRLDDYAPAIALARGVELNKDNSSNPLAGAILSGGKYEEAVQQLAPLAATAEKSSRDAKTSTAYPLFFLAMSHHQLGKKDEAHTTLKRPSSWPRRS
jgi:hypothetical protein